MGCFGKFDVFYFLKFYIIIIFLKLNFILDIARRVRPFNNPNNIKTFRIKSIYDASGHFRNLIENFIFFHIFLIFNIFKIFHFWTF